MYVLAVFYFNIDFMVALIQMLSLSFECYVSKGDVDRICFAEYPSPDGNFLVSMGILDGMGDCCCGEHRGNRHVTAKTCCWVNLLHSP